MEWTVRNEIVTEYSKSILFSEMEGIVDFNHLLDSGHESSIARSKP